MTDPARPPVPEDETLDALTDGMRIYQKKERAFRFGTDSVLLADFAGAKKHDLAVDLGAGTGVISLLMCDRAPDFLCDAVEIQPDMAEMARRSVRLNAMEHRIRVHTMDMREAPKRLGCDRYTLAVCNPPYGRAGAGTGREDPGEQLARHETDCSIRDVAVSASRLLKTGGRLACIFPAQRMFELMQAMQAAGLAPKRVQLVQHRPGKPPARVLADAVKGGGSQLHWLPPLVLTGEGGGYSAEWNRIYRIGEDV